LQVLSALLLLFQDALRYRATGTDIDVINRDIVETVIKFSRAFPNADLDAAAAAVEDTIYQLTRNANALLALAALSIRLKAVLNGKPVPT